MLSPGRAQWSVVVTHRGKLGASDGNRYTEQGHPFHN